MYKIDLTALTAQRKYHELPQEVALTIPKFGKGLIKAIGCNELMIDQIEGVLRKVDITGTIRMAREDVGEPWTLSYVSLRRPYQHKGKYFGNLETHQVNDAAELVRLAGEAWAAENPEALKEGELIGLHNDIRNGAMQALQLANNFNAIQEEIGKLLKAEAYLLS